MSLQKSLTYLLACFSTQLENCSLEDYFLVYFCMFTADNKNILCHFAKIHYFDYNHELVILIILILLSIMITMPILTIYSSSIFVQMHFHFLLFGWKQGKRNQVPRKKSFSKEYTHDICHFCVGYSFFFFFSKIDI